MSCSCGAPASGSGSQCRRCSALAVLELKAGANEHEIRAAYRLMVKVWHPDRFPGDEPLRKAAETKLKEINAAYQLLSWEAPHSASQHPSPSSPTPSQPEKSAAPPPAAEDYQRAATDAREASHAYQQTAGTQGRAASESRSTSAPPPPGPQAPPRSASRPRAASYAPRRAAAVRRSSTSGTLFLRSMALVLAALITRYVWIAFDASDTARDDAAQAQSTEEQSFWQSLEPPKQRFLAAVKKDLNTLGFKKMELPSPNSDGAEKMPRSPQRANARRPGKPSSDSDAESYITVGTTRDQVVEQLGNPTRASRNVFVYDSSEIYFRGDNVVGWRIDPASSPIHVKLWPRTFVDPDLSVFGVGSSKDDVLAIQGTPTALTEDKFEYGGSEVYFKDDQVVGWKNDLTSVPLHVEKK